MDTQHRVKGIVEASMNTERVVHCIWSHLRLINDYCVF